MHMNSWRNCGLRMHKSPIVFYSKMCKLIWCTHTKKKGKTTTFMEIVEVALFTGVFLGNMIDHYMKTETD